MNRFSFEFSGSTMTWEYKRFAHLCNSAVFGTWGNSAVNVTVLRGPAQENANFFPLQVEYLEKYYASGKVMSSPYVKREGFPSESAILRGRIIDRAIRPRFPKELVDQVQVFATVLSYDVDNDPLILAFNTAVAALMASDIPFEGKLAGIRMGLSQDGLPIAVSRDVTSLKVTANNENHPMNMVLGLDPNGVVMFDAEMTEVPEATVKEAIARAKDLSQTMWNAQESFVKEHGIEKKEGTMLHIPAELVEKLESVYGNDINAAISDKSKEVRKGKIDEIATKVKEEHKEDESVLAYQVDGALEKVMKKYIRKSVLEANQRIDGRNFDEIRTLGAETSILPKTHGSAVFKRGDTHSLTIVTLASPAKQQSLEDMTGEDVATYLHEYSAPPYAYGETGRMAYKPGRREIGHGALAEKALIPVIPSQEAFPYMIRVVSEIMSSAGSTSMASTCGSTLALMDAGVPIKAPVAGISVGVIANDDFSSYHLLTDIEEIEDFYGEMDFKVAGTEAGITAIQMDEKRMFIPYEVINEAIDAGKLARTTILKVITDAIAAPRERMSEYAPQIERITIDPEKIGKLIGPGGKMIKEITRLSGMDLNIKDDGTVEIFGAPAEARAKAREMIDALFEEFKTGEIYEGMVLETRPFGAIVKISRGDLEGKGLIHVSELADGFVKNPEDVVKAGQRVRVKVVGLDDMGRLKLSLKQVPKE
ncbi:MAG: polyribonucleotide nucleotidyltransferase [Candidatus Dojkabacteria bacterium]|nr:MAG: polyribonucleotide nucleotidyltransferase [Candidatus Dojkabacteria bacterium]